MSEDELLPYVTTDTPFAAYLYLRGMVVLDAVSDKTNLSIKKIVFVDDPLRPQYEQEYYNGAVEFQEYHKALKQILKLVKRGVPRG